MLDILRDELASASSSHIMNVVINDKQIDLTVGEFNELFDGTGFTVTPKEGLRLRAQPTTTSKTLIVIPQNSGIILLSNQIVQSNGYHWMNAKYGGYSGWLAAEYIKQAPPMPPKSNYKLGVHVYPQTSLDASQNANGNLFDTAERLYNLKRPMSFTILEDIALANKLVSHCNYLVYRPYINEHFEIDDNYNNAIAQGEQFTRKYYDKFSSVTNLKNVYIQLTNEGDNCDTRHKNFGAFNLGIMRQLERYSRKGVIFNDSVGTPETSHMIERQSAIDYAIANNHVFGYHAYGQPGLDLSDKNAGNVKWFARRYEWLYPKNAKIIINEAGRFDAQFINIENTVNDMKQFNRDIENDSRVLCVNWWQYNGQGSNWNHSVINSALSSIEQMIKAY